MNCDYKEAKTVISAYLNAYPGLKRYMHNCNASVKKYGMTKTKFGRIRHLPEAKELFDKYGNDLLDFKWARANNLVEERKLFKNCLNNAKNFPIQGLAGHIINRAMIEIAKEFKKRKLDARIALMVHDQVVCIAKEEIAEEVKQIMQDKMENTTKLTVPLVAVPEIADNLAESH
jgi:DNA polymerase-1